MRRVAESVAIAGVARAAAECGVLDALRGGPARVDELADRLALAPRPLQRLTDALVALGLARREGDRLALGPEADGHPLGLELEVALWSHAPEWLRTGSPLPGLDAGAGAYRDVVAGLASLWGDAPDRVAAALPRPPRRVLDLGCGAGPWSLAIAARHPEAAVTGLDRPGVVARFLEAATARGLADRVIGVAGDLDAPPQALGDGYDLVLLANVLRLDGPEVARARTLAAVGRLAPGGALLVVDTLADGPPETSVARTLYAVHLSLRRAEGTLLADRTLRTWLAEAGLREVVPLPVGPSPSPLDAVWAS